MADVCFVLRHSSEPEAQEHHNGRMMTDPQSVNSVGPEEEHDEGYARYVETHGKHFTEALAVWASGQMRHIPYADASHIWNAEDVRSSYERLGLIKPVTNTWGDAVYASNMNYSDYYGLTLRTETECIKQGQADLSDPDGYPEKMFMHWCADMKAKGISVPWKDYI